MTTPGFAVPPCARIGLGGCVTRLVEIRVAQMLGRTVTAVRSQLARLQATKKNWWWTEEQIQFLRDNLATMRIDDISRHLGRTIGAINLKLYSLGLTRDNTLMIGERDTRARELHAAGKFDKEIAKEIGVSDAVVWHWRNRNGLKVNGHASTITPESIAKTKRTFLKRYGTETIKGVLAAWHRKCAAELGWDCAATADQARVCEILSSGPKMGNEIGAALGRKPLASGRYSLSMLGRMMKSRIVVKRWIGKQVEYALAPGIQRSGRSVKNPPAEIAA